MPRDRRQSRQGDGEDVAKGTSTSMLHLTEGLVPTFTGQDKAFPVTRWIEEVEDNAEIFGWTPVQQLLVARRSLAGTAALWLRAEKSYKTWDELKAAIAKEFPDVIDSKTIHEMMSSRMKTSEESCIDYMLIMKELGKRGKMADYVAIKYIVEGIQDSPMNKMLLYGITTYGELKEKLKIYESLKETSRTTTTQEVKNSRPKGSAKKNRGCYNCGDLHHMSNECPDKQKGMKCFRCNEFGHISSNCTNIPTTSAASTSKKTTSSRQSGVLAPKQMCVNVKAERLVETTDDEFTESEPTCTVSGTIETCDVDISTVKMTATDVNSDSPCRKPMKEIVLYNKSVQVLIDSGSDINLISLDCYRSLNAPEYVKDEIVMSGLGSTCVRSLGYLKTDITIDGQNYENVVLYIVPGNCMPFSMILGQDFLRNVTFVMEGSRVLLMKSNESWFRNLMCGVTGVYASDVLGYISDPVLRADVNQMVETYRPMKTCEAPVQLRITLRDDVPVAQRPRRLAVVEQQEVERQVKQWLIDGVIRVSHSEYASPLVLVKKKDGSTRICVDYRLINKKMVKDEYPLPIIEDHIDKLATARVFSTLDLKNGYFHLTVHEDSVKYTAFVTHNSQFEFLKAPFGLSVCPKVFTRFITAIFRDFIEKGHVLVFIDDVIILAEDEVQAVSRLREVLYRASQYGLEINWKKTQLVQRKVEYLGHVVENGTVKPSPDKTDAVVRFPEPINVKQLHGFVGLTSYFRKYIQNYALIARPLTELLKKDVDFEFGTPQRKAFQELKMKLVNKPVLKIFDPQLYTELHTDASMLALSAILLQRSAEDGQLHPVYYLSKKTNEAEKKYTSYELEALAVIESVKKFRHYLFGIKFKIVTDCQAFEMTLRKKDMSTRVARWALVLQEYDYEVEHRTGSQMRHVDALSRAPYVGVITRELHDRIKAAQEQDGGLKAIREILSEKAYLDYVIENGVLYKGQKLVVPNGMEHDVIKKVHEKGHFAKKKMMELIDQDYHIRDLSRKIEEFMVTCIPCLLATRKSGKQEGFLQCIDKGSIPMHTIHCDHVGPLSETKKQYNYILTLVDAFTKFVWVFPTKSTTAKETLDKLRVHQQAYGNPFRLITDRGAAFTSNDFKDYCENEGIQHVLVTTGVPRGNGQVERIHRVIIAVLTKLCIVEPGLWYKHVTRLQMALNSTYQRSIDTTPFELLHGTKMRTKEDIQIYEMLEQENRDGYNEDREKLRKSARMQIMKIQQENRMTYNRKRKESRVYRVGDKVAIMRTQFGTCLKLKPKFFGPYRVTAVRGKDRYEVEKAESSSEGPARTSTSADNMKPWPSG